jgi:sugar phosphate isomerase/epimerase
VAPVERRARGRGRGADLILCSGTLGGIPFPEKARAAAAAGFTGISVYAREHEPGLRPLLDDLGLSVAEVDGALGWLPGQPGTEVSRALDIAAELGARSLTVVEVTGEAPDPGVAADAFGLLCDRAVPLGITVHLEPFAWSGISTMAAAHEVVARAGHRNGGIILDTWHLVRGPDAGVLDPVTVGSIVAVQVADPSPDASSLSLRDECMTDRRLPGPASARIVAQLPAGLPLEVEVFGLPGPPVAAARAAYGALRELQP